MKDNPFAKLGSLDQKLFEDTASKPQVKEPQKNPKLEAESKKEISTTTSSPQTPYLST